MLGAKIDKLYPSFLPILVVTSIFWGIVGCSQPKVEETVEPLTLAHENEARSMIESYYLGIGSLARRQDPQRASKVATGPMLEVLLPFETPAPSDTFIITKAVKVKEVHILEYSSSTVKAIGCGVGYDERVSFDGKLIRSFTPWSFRNVFVFVYEDAKWKLFTQYTFVDTEEAIRDWEYVTEEEKKAIGDLPSYMDLYLGCDMTIS